jgi:hypothetical protein
MTTELYSLESPLGLPQVANPVRGWQGGRVLYVCSGGGAEGQFGDGRTPGRPLASLFGTTAKAGQDGALARLENRTNRGDVIYVLPGHTESVDAADKGVYTGTASGFSIVGLGTGDQRPKFTWTTATSTWLLDTAGVEIANCIFYLAGAHAAGSALTVAAPITVSADDCRIVNCRMFWGFDADQIVADGIIVTGDRFEFIGNKCTALVAAVPTNTFLVLTGADDCLIRGNWIEGATDATTKGVIDGETTESLRIMVEYNYLANLLASSTIALSPVASSTGTARRNDFFVNSGILPITASLLSWHENYCVDTAGQAGALVGTASS